MTNAQMLEIVEYPGAVLRLMGMGSMWPNTGEIAISVILLSSPSLLMDQQERSFPTGWASTGWTRPREPSWGRCTRRETIQKTSTFTTQVSFILWRCEAGQAVCIVAGFESWMVGPDITSDKGSIKTKKKFLPTPPIMGYEFWDDSAWQGDETILFTFDNNWF